MKELALALERLGLSGYLDVFVTEGFDTWTTLLDITESDLSALGVKLGHRRKLQRAIAGARGQPVERALALENGKIVATETGYQTDESIVDAKDSSGHITPAPPALTPLIGTKRKYRRHPKADDNAPERPPSAYVIFSNQVREELKGQEWSFTEIAKLVGERWQVLDPSIRESYEKQAGAAKEKYYTQMAEYKTTPQYQEYQNYLADFKAKHATPRTDGKRSKIQQESGLESPNAISNRRRGSAISLDSTVHNHRRSHSNSLGGSAGVVGMYVPPLTSASASPPQGSVGLQSPLATQTFSPRTRTPPIASAYAGSYELSHRARITHISIDVRPPLKEARLQEPISKETFLRDSNSESKFYEDNGDLKPRDPVGHPPPPRNWQQSLRDAARPQVHGDNLGRRGSHSSASLPSLVHQDTSVSSVGESLPPPSPYQVHHLPPFEAPKTERLLSQTLPPIVNNRIVASPMDFRSNHALRPPPALDPPPPITHQTSPLDALLRASELAARDDLQADLSKPSGLRR